MAISKLLTAGTTSPSSPQHVGHKRLFDGYPRATALAKGTVPTLPTRRRVRIDESQNKTYLTPAMAASTTAADRHYSSWFTTEDYRRFKRETHDLAHVIHHRESTMQKRLANCYKNVILRIYQQCMQDDDDHRRAAAIQTSRQRDATLLQGMMTKSHGRVGLELMCVRELSSESSRRRKELVATIVALNASTSHTQNNHHNHQKQEDADTLRRTRSEHLSRPLRLLAHELAVHLAASLELDK